MTENVSPITILPAPGEPFEGGFYGGAIRSHGGKKAFAIAWAPKSTEFRARLLSSYIDVPGAASCFHSMDNTRAFAAAGSLVAQRALETTINSFSDWCLPARDVQELAYRLLKPGTAKNYCSFRDGDNPSSIPSGYPYTKESPGQTSVEAFREGGAEAFEQDWYGTVTQYSAGSVWLQHFDGGNQSHLSKTAEVFWRLVRLIQIDPSIL